jgi:hypothetical protein
MPIARNVLEGLLEVAKSERDAAAAKVKTGDKKTNPGWRQADAKYRQLVRRLKAVSNTEARDQAVRERAESSDE